MNALTLEYSPYEWNSDHFEGASGIEWDFNQVVSSQYDKVIKYDNYASCAFDTYWSNLVEWFKKEKNVDLEETDRQNFEQCVKQIYDTQFANHTNGNYYFYVSEKAAIEDWNNGYSKGLEESDILRLCTTGDPEREGYLSVSELDIDSINEVGVTDFKNYILKYHEIEWQDQNIYPRVTKISIFAPVGTMFFLNNIFRPIYVSDWVDRNNPQVLYGMFNLDTNNTMLLNKITFPKQAAPIFNYENTNLNITQTQMKNLKIIVVIYYDVPNE